jgi:hypothetical protein
MIKKIIKQVLLIFGQAKVKLIAHYGNKGGRDIDIFVILADEAEYNCIKDGQFDISYVGLPKALEMARNLDPLFTEPMIFGTLIYKQKDFEKVIIKVNQKKEVSRYLRKKAKEIFNWAEKYFQRKDLKPTSDCIRFSLSFHIYSLYYQENDQIIDFKSILKLYPEEAFWIKKAEVLAKSQQVPAFELVQDLILKNREFLTYYN